MYIVITERNCIAEQGIHTEQLCVNQNHAGPIKQLPAGGRFVCADKNIVC